MFYLYPDISSPLILIYMSIDSDSIFPKICEELDKLPLSSKQKEEVTPKLLEYARFMSTSGGKRIGVEFRDDSTIFNFEKRFNIVAQHFSAEGLTVKDYLQAALKQPALFMQSPDTIVANIFGVAERFGTESLTVKDYLKAAITHPSLFCQSPATIVANITGVVKRFAKQGLTLKDYLKAILKRPALFSRSPDTIAANILGVVNEFSAEGLIVRDYLKAALKQPALFYQSPTTIIGNITGVIERFAAEGLGGKDYLRAACRQPPLFYQSPSTIIANITGMVDQFAAEGMTAKDYLKAAIKQPPLFCQSPSTIAANITGVVERFAEEGLTISDYLKAAIKQPPLFYQKPATIIRHIELFLAMYDSGIFLLPKPRHKEEHSTLHPHLHMPVFTFLLNNPIMLCRDDSNIHLRRIYMELSGGMSNSRILFSPRHEIERKLMQHLGHSDPAFPVSKNANPVLLSLIHEGYIKSASLEDL
ncbi:MAG: hypothetical protein EBR02_00685 [Alphaproteobacteria bacterium]|nr:hypothetical protein [Alphaproteobacteria bacterium]